jgi:hypothetical protein
MAKAKAPQKWGLKPRILLDGVADKERVLKRVFEIPEKSGIKLSKNLEKKFKTTVEVFHYKHTHLERLPTISELKILLKDVSDSAEKFESSLENIRNPEIKSLFDLPPQYQSDRSTKMLIEGAKHWKMAADVAIALLPKTKTGPIEDVFLKEFILSLAELYEQATGKKAEPGWCDDKYKNELHGEFALFVQKILDKIDTSTYQSNRSLTENLKKILPKKNSI